ncbi:hypothetical protein QFC19_004538 [Naganishia cerealis]|uniref:Uncharacterized protein n=1 Tax=Naganishia cerealis TaxID=610337 RepID=A0ACC2VV17_9TREE|nr:hypothetical protein QFC19_004538 [Naganishia cerealis]
MTLSLFTLERYPHPQLGMTQDCNPDSINALKREIEAYHSRLSDEAERAVFVVLPLKVLELSRLVESFSNGNKDSPFTVLHPSFECDTTILTLPATTPTEGYRPSYCKTPLTPSSVEESTPVDAMQSVGTILSADSPAFSATDASHDAGALSGEHEDDKPVRTGLATNPIFELVGKLMEEQGADVLRFCMQIRRWMATVTPQVEEGNNTG